MTVPIVFAMAVGLAFGSFLNVALSRLPRGESLVRPPSHCEGCGRRLAWWENIPVASYLALGGRCRACRRSIGLRHLLVEMVSGLLFALGAGLMLMRAGEAGRG